MRFRPPGRALWLLGGLLACYLAIPLVAFLVRLARSSDPGFSAPGLLSALGISVETATISTVLISLFGLPLAYLLARRHGRISSVVGVVSQLPLALPPLMSGILLIYLVGPYSAAGRFFGQHLTESTIGVVLAQTFVAAPFLVGVARASFSDLDPAIFDLAATLGHGEGARYLLAVRCARGGIVAGMLLAWLRAFGEYGATVILAYHPYSLPVFTYLQFSGTGLTGTEAPTALALAVAAAVVIAAHRATRPARRARRPVSLVPPSQPPSATGLLLGFDLALQRGAFRLKVAHQASAANLAILGPSGSGKSTTLRAIAGLLGPRAGAVYFDGQPVQTLPPETRHVGYVPQSGSLIPIFDVWRQVNFGRETDRGLASFWIHRLDLETLVGRMPDQLSGGQRQRVHFAQALASAPRLLLLDEPFSALDVPVREALRLEFRQLAGELGLSSVLVTHDPEEAAMLADELLVIDEGRLLQAGGRDDVFAHPASPTVARLLGIENVLPGVVRDGVLAVGGVALAIAGAHLGPVNWCVSAELVRIEREGRFEAVALEVIERGFTRQVLLGLGDGNTLIARLRSGPAPVLGERCRFTVDADAITVFTATDTSSPLAATLG